MRDSFSIRQPINISGFDMVINPTSEQSIIQIKREITLKVMGLAAGFFFLWLALMFDSPLKNGGFLASLIWTTGYVWLVDLLIAPTMTRELGLNLIPVSVHYSNNALRDISSQLGDDAAAFAAIVAPAGVMDDGTIVFKDQSVGRVYDLVGNASMQMFDDDRNAVLRQVGRFYRGIKPLVHLVFDSVQSPQRVQAQLLAKDKQLQQLPSSVKPLAPVRNLALFEKLVLRDYVGHDFRSLHQRLVVVAPNKEILKPVEDLLAAHAQRDGNFVKDYRPFDYDETIDYFHDFYSLDFSK